MAATVSVEHKSEHMSRTSPIWRFKTDSVPSDPLICITLSLAITSRYKKVKPENAMKQIKVPTIPKSAILAKLAKKSFLYMLKPLAKTIGGKHT